MRDAWEGLKIVWAWFNGADIRPRDGAKGRTEGTAGRAARKVSPWRPVLTMDGRATAHEYRVKG